MAYFKSIYGHQERLLHRIKHLLESILDLGAIFPFGLNVNTDLTKFNASILVTTLADLIR